MDTEFGLFKFSVFKLLIALEFLQKFLGLIQMLLIEIYAESFHALRNICFHLIILRLYLFLQLVLLLCLNHLLLLLVLNNLLLRNLFFLTLLKFLVNYFFDFWWGGHVLSLINGLRFISNCGLLRLLLLNDLWLYSRYCFWVTLVFLLINLGLSSNHLLQFNLRISLVKFLLRFQSLLFLLILLLW